MSGQTYVPRFKVMVINGSPRTGNTERLLTYAVDAFIDHGWGVDRVQIGRLALRGCQGCLQCHKLANNTCVLDDGFNSIFQRMLSCDAVIIGSPTYIADVTASVKAFLERALSVATANGFALRGKIGAAVAMHNRTGGERANETINSFFLLSQMLVPGTFGWSVGVGAKPGEVEKDMYVRAVMRQLGDVINHVAVAMEPYKGAWPAVPKFS